MDLRPFLGITVVVALTACSPELPTVPMPPRDSPAASGDGPISYNGGSVLTGDSRLYLIWYGSWSQSDASVGLVQDFARHLGGSSWMAINSAYTDGNGKAPSGGLALAGISNDPYSHGKTLSSPQSVMDVVATNVGWGSLPLDGNGIYVVIGASDVSETDACTVHCGWHTWGYARNTPLTFAYLVDPVSCPQACGPLGTPNGDLAADGLVSILAHEVSESLTDPRLDAWHDSQGEENADRCGWSFGPVVWSTSGEPSNLTLGDKRWLVQENWVLPTQACGMHP